VPVAARPGEPSASARLYGLPGCGGSIDGDVDDASGDRPVLSSEADFHQGGGGPVRRDNPWLPVWPSAWRRAAQVAGGRRPAPVLITVTGGRDPDAALGGVEKLVRRAGPALRRARAKPGVATVVLLRCAFSDRFGEVG